MNPSKGKKITEYDAYRAVLELYGSQDPRTEMYANQISGILFENHIDLKRIEKNPQIISNIATYCSMLENEQTTIELINCDFRESSVEDESIDFIITDPPYPKKYINLYKDLSEFANRVLRPGGSLITLAGQSYIPEVLDNLSSNTNMKYHWMACYLTPGGQSPMIWQRRVNAFWKPLLWFVKGKYEGKWIGDVTRSNVNNNDKRYHEWGQSESGMLDIVNRFTYPGDMILDPLMGAGTLGIVCKETHRRFTGIEIDKEIFQTALQRIQKTYEIIR